MSQDIESIVAARRSTYEALKREGQTHAPRALPGPSSRPAPALLEQNVLHNEHVPGGWYWSTELRRGEALRLHLHEGPAAVALVAWCLTDPSERLNYADTIKVQWTAHLCRGRVLLSDMGRVMLSIVADSCEAHDTIAGGSTPQSVRAMGGNQPMRNTRDNFRLAAAKLGLSRKDVPPCISFFAPVSTDAEGRLTWHGTKRRTGDFVDLRAEMDLVVAVSNCPHPLDPESAFVPPAIQATRFQAPPPAPDDLCRTATAEAIRGFENTDALLASKEISR